LRGSQKVRQQHIGKDQAPFHPEEIEYPFLGILSRPGGGFQGKKEARGDMKNKRLTLAKIKR
jgi:hypothetical protein